jgi:hypothetical protein
VGIKSLRVSSRSHLDSANGKSKEGTKRKKKVREGGEEIDKKKKKQGSEGMKGGIKKGGKGRNKGKK